MKNSTIFSLRNLGLIGYKESLKIMQREMAVLVQQKKILFLALQHPLVYTSGLKIEREHLVDKKIQVMKTRRGGSITLHNPSQAVVYTLIPTNLLDISLSNLIRLFEAAIIKSLLEIHITSFLVPKVSGVFTAKGKIGFTGIGVKKKCIFHGVSINLANDLNDFNKILSCGLTIPITNAIENSEKLTFNQKRIFQFERSFYKHFKYLLVRPTGGNLRRRYSISNEKNQSNLEHFLKGLASFNAQCYWLAHEEWEFLWHKVKIKQYLYVFIQGLIQLAMSLHKLKIENNIKGAISLMTKSHEKLNISRFTTHFNLKIANSSIEIFQTKIIEIMKSHQSIKDEPRKIKLFDDIYKYFTSLTLSSHFEREIISLWGLNL